jgi:hypothetical protein
MRRVGIAELPLHAGRCPAWLFDRMKRLGGAVAAIIISEYGRSEFLRRMADPFFFQALGCALGFDWHSSGITTTVCGAMKEAVDMYELGIAICGGKGRASRRTPIEIEEAADAFSLPSGKADSLKRASGMVAKVDNACVQDGYQLYQHCFIMSEDGGWAVIQQGMREAYARRYHWISEGIRSFVEEPHSGIASDRREGAVLDMTARQSDEARKVSLDIVKEDPIRLRRYIRDAQASIEEYLSDRPKAEILIMPSQHHIPELSERTMLALRRAYELQPGSYEELVAIKGIGPRSIRALALISELIYGKPPSWRDPAKYSFAHGGKDGIPYPVDRDAYDKTIEVIEDAIKMARVAGRERISAVRRLHALLL